MSSLLLNSVSYREQVHSQPGEVVKIIIIINPLNNEIRGTCYLKYSRQQGPGQGGYNVLKKSCDSFVVAVHLCIQLTIFTVRYAVM